MSKSVTPYLRLGDKVKAAVREVLADGHLIASFEGDLLNVKNNTKLSLQVGSSITLEVIRLRPLSFKMIVSRPAAIKDKDLSWRV